MSTVRFWAGARALAGKPDHDLDPGPLQDVLAAIGSEFGPQLASLLERSVLLLDGERIDRATNPLVGPGSCLEVLPPYAGG